MDRWMDVWIDQMIYESMNQWIDLSMGNSNRIPPISNTTQSPPRYKILQYAEVEEERVMTLARIDGWMD